MWVICMFLFSILLLLPLLIIPLFKLSGIISNRAFVFGMISIISSVYLMILLRNPIICVIVLITGFAVFSFFPMRIKDYAIIIAKNDCICVAYNGSEMLNVNVKNEGTPSIGKIIKMGK